MGRSSRQAASQPDTDEGGRIVAQPPEEDALRLLADGEILGGRRIHWGSNYTFLVHIDAGPGQYVPAVYKPKDGESPLYDFPTGSLYKREYAAYVLCRALGWPAIPPTVLRDGPYGVGSIQLFIESDSEATYFDLVEEKRDELIPFALFDFVANNADRKAGHCILGQDGRIWSIDHGLTFHQDFKVRTVMLDLWGAQIPKSHTTSLNKVVRELEAKEGVVAELFELLTDDEIDALRRRAELVLEDPVIPALDPYRNVPWPLV